MQPASIQDLVESHFAQSEDLDSLLEVIKKAEDCPDDDEECKEVICPGCGGKPLHTIFGTLPLQVKCDACSSTFLLRKIILS